MPSSRYHRYAACAFASPCPTYLSWRQESAMRHGVNHRPDYGRPMGRVTLLWEHRVVVAAAHPGPPRPLLSGSRVTLCLDFGLRVFFCRFCVMSQRGQYVSTEYSPSSSCDNQLQAQQTQRQYSYYSMSIKSTTVSSSAS